MNDAIVGWCPFKGMDAEMKTYVSKQSQSTSNTRDKDDDVCEAEISTSEEENTSTQVENSTQHWNNHRFHNDTCS